MLPKLQLRGSGFHGKWHSGGCNMMQLFMEQCPGCFQFKPLLSGMPVKSACSMLRSNQSANSWNLSVARQIKTMNTIVEVSGITTVQNEFPRCFQIVFFPLFSSSFWSVVLWPTLTCWYCQAKGLQELLAEARAATADLQVLCYTLCIFIYLYGYIFTYLAYLGIQWPLQVKFKTTVAEHEETMRRQLQDRVESCRNWRARIGKTTWKWTNEDHNKNLVYLHLSSTAEWTGWVAVDS